MRAAIIGGGLTGLTAAFDLAQPGNNQVTIYEASDHCGGLAAGFKDTRWDWPLERFYHHLFEGDAAIRNLANEIGYGEGLFFRRPVTAQWHNGHFYPVDGALDLLRFPALSFLDRLRMGMVGAYLKYVTNDWRSLEKTPVEEWVRRWMGEKSYNNFWYPLLDGKFGADAPKVNMAWLWARMKSRSFKLGYFARGFQGFVDALTTAIKERGVEIKVNERVDLIAMSEDRWTLYGAKGNAAFDKVIFTGSPALLKKLAPQLPVSYADKLVNLRSLGAVVVILALKKPLTNGLYWMQGWNKAECPFLALIEHTNFIESEHYGGDHLIYCGDYLPASHEYFGLSLDEILARFLPALKRFNPEFEPDWVRDAWLQREAYAQPVVGINHSQNIPPLATPIPGLYWASMSHVYPWDRGSNYAVDLGHRVAQVVVKSNANE